MSRPSVLNISKFSRLVSGDNPQNIRNHELAELTNAYITPQYTIKGRKGYTTLADISDTYFINAIKKITWSDGSTDFYVFKNGEFGTIDEVAGTYTKIDDMSGGKRVYTNAWKDNLVFMHPNQRPQRLKNDESTKYDLLSPPSIASVQLWPGTQSNDSDSELDAGTYFYCISVGYGDEETGQKHGESPLGELSGYGENFLYYAGITSADAQKTQGSIYTTLSRHGWDIVSVTLWRKYCTNWSYDGGILTIEDPQDWRPVDYAEVEYDGGYALLGDSITGIISSISGTDPAFIVSFEDNGTRNFTTTDFPVGSEPYTRGEIVTDIKAKCMERWGNRMVFANITNEDFGAKKFYFTYRGWKKGVSELAGGSQYEIPGFAYGDPMPVVAATSYAWVDQYNVEDEIVGLKAVGDTLYIFTERRIWKFKEGYPEPVMITDNVGCVSKYSIQEIDGIIVWLDRDGVYTYDGNKIKNISVREIDSYIDDIDTDKYQYYPSIMFDRKYWLAVEVSGTPTVLVYDFETQSWHTREYSCNATAARIDWFCKWDGKLYAGIKDISGSCEVGWFENGTQDGDGQQGTPDDIEVTVKTKAFDMGNPQFSKLFRAVYLDMYHVPHEVTVSTYIDDYETAHQTITHTIPGGFVLGSATDGVLGTSTLSTYADEMAGFSLERGSHGSRMQVGFESSVSDSDMEIRVIGIDYFVRRNAKLKYGG